MLLTTGVQSPSNIDWFAAIRAGQAFAGNSNGGPTAGQVSFVQLYNPGASGRVVFVKAAWAYEATADLIFVRNDVTAEGAITGSAANLAFNYSAGVAVIRSGTAAAAPGNDMLMVGIPAAVSTKVVDDWFLMLPQGVGCIIDTVALNVLLRVTFEWVEVPL